MRKLNRREFKELLTEWHSNFINERNIKDLGGLTGISGRPEQIAFVKEVPVNLSLYAIGDYYIDREGRVPVSDIIIEAMKESQFVYKETDGGLILEKACIPELIEVLELVLNQTQFSYQNKDGDLVFDTSAQEKVSSSIEQMKKDLARLVSDEYGIMLYFYRMDSYSDSMADGSINRIGSIQDPAIWKNSLSWELKHDVFHYFESVLVKEKSESYEFLRSTFMNNENIYKVLSHYEVPDQKLKSLDPSVRFGSSFGSGDNFATVIPYIRSLKNNEDNKKYFVATCIEIAKSRDINLSDEDKDKLKKFFSEVHTCYEEIENILRDKIIIQLPHG